MLPQQYKALSESLNPELKTAFASEILILVLFGQKRSSVNYFASKFTCNKQTVPGDRAEPGLWEERRWHWPLCGQKSELLGLLEDCQDRDTSYSPTIGPE